jgi:protein-S-isoprenylcysteine O-methyltransferase Ste14
MRTYLFLVVFWSLLAVGAFFYPHWHPEARWTILDTDWSIGWVLLAFAAYNLLRWWTTLPARSVDQSRESAGPARKDCS